MSMKGPNITLVKILTPCNLLAPMSLFLGPKRTADISSLEIPPKRCVMTDMLNLKEYIRGFTLCNITSRDT